MKITLSKFLAASALALVSACSVGPDYVRPIAIAPEAFKEQAGWKPSLPQDAIDRGPWWAIYNDPILADFERRVDVSNQNLKAAEAAYRQAQSIVDAGRASFLPFLSGNFSFQRNGRGAGATGTGFTSLSSGSRVQNQYSAGLTANWDIDVWGRIRRTVEGNLANAQASAADIASARLSAQATLAVNYFQLRVQDELKNLLDTAVVDYRQSLQIAQNRYNAGVATKADVVTAQTQLLNAQSQVANVGLLRQQYEHAIAVLTGQPPALLTIVAAPLSNIVPTVPAGMPSTLLERRPDIAQAERQVAAVNAQIGVAISAFFPNLSLSGADRYNSRTFDNLFSLSNRIWSWGPALADTLFDVGQRSAQVDQARAAHEQSVAIYRQAVLNGFQEVEDQLSNLRKLENLSGIQSDLVASAQEQERLTLNQYKAGTIPYSSVIIAQTTAQSARQGALNVLQNRLVASVALIQALGGGWNENQLPTPGQIENDASFLRIVPIGSLHDDTPKSE